jgi:HEAT repeat protein
MNDKTSNPQLNAVLTALLDNSQLFPENLLPFFSDIYPDDLEEVKKIWSKIALERRISILADLEDMMEADMMLSCDGLAKFALNDDFPEVRGNAITLLWECDDPKLAPRFVEMLKNDESELVQTAAAAALGKFVLLGELDEIPSSATVRTIKALVGKLRSKPTKEIHQEILKSLAYSSDPMISPMIEKAFMDTDLSWRLAAVISMGRSADDRWEKPVLQMIKSDDPELKNEAVKAAGELELSSARAMLLQILEDEEDDIELRTNAIWALSKIGGENVKSVLQRLLEAAPDEEEAEVIELAIEALDFSSELPDLDI